MCNNPLDGVPENLELGNTRSTLAQGVKQIIQDNQSINKVEIHNEVLVEIDKHQNKEKKGGLLNDKPSITFDVSSVNTKKN